MNNVATGYQVHEKHKTVTVRSTGVSSSFVNVCSRGMNSFH